MSILNFESPFRIPTLLLSAAALTFVFTSAIFRFTNEIVITIFAKLRWRPHNKRPEGYVECNNKQKILPMQKKIQLIPTGL